MVARMNVESRVFQTVRRYEVKQSSSVGIGSGLVGKIDGQGSVSAEESWWVLYYGTGCEARAEIGNSWNERWHAALRKNTDRHEDVEKRVNANQQT